MKIPEFVLTHEVMIEEFKGRASKGAVYGAPYPAKCFIRPLKERRRKQGAEGGVTDVPQAKAFFPPEVLPPVGSKITYGSQVYTVIRAITQMTPAGPHHVEVEMG